MSSAWPPDWLAAAARAEQWNPATMPQIRASLDRLGGAELERRGNDVCVVDGHCEPIEVGPSLPVLAAIERLVAAERTRRNDEKRQQAKLASAKESLRLCESEPLKQHPHKR